MSNRVRCTRICKHCGTVFTGKATLCSTCNSRIRRYHALARKSCSVGLSDSESRELNKLMQEYKELLGYVPD